MNSTLLQQRGFNKLNRLKVGAIFSAMGTGKTKMALDLMAYKKKADYLLWICPCSLKGTIEEERQKWHPELKLHVVGVESIGSSNRIYAELLEELSHQNCIFCVVDESLKIKNGGAKRTQRLLTISKLCEYKLILNGTPLTNNVLDLYTQFQFLSPLILSESLLVFKNKYCEYYTRGERKGMVRKQCNMENLISRVKPYIFDAKLDLKADKRYFDKPYELGVRELAQYEAIKDEFIRTVSDSAEISFYVLVTRLHEFLASCESKRRALEEAVKGLGKAICFVKFIKSIPEGARHITGDMKQEERAQVIEEFKQSHGDQVLYITYGCGAFGLNLQFCHTIVFADRTWDYAMMAQAEARVYRIGQNEDVSYITLYAENIGLEKILTKNLTRKTDMLKEVKEEISVLNQEEQKKWLKKYL